MDIFDRIFIYCRTAVWWCFMIVGGRLQRSTRSREWMAAFGWSRVEVSSFAGRGRWLNSLDWESRGKCHPVVLVFICWHHWSWSFQLMNSSQFILQSFFSGQKSAIARYELFRILIELQRQWWNWQWCSSQFSKPSWLQVISSHTSISYDFKESFLPRGCLLRSTELPWRL